MIAVLYALKSSGGRLHSRTLTPARLGATIAAAAVLFLAGCAGYAMPRSIPTKGQTAEAMERDRSECESRAKESSGTSQGAYIMLGGPTSAVGQEVAQKRETAFIACLETRGYTVTK